LREDAVSLALLPSESSPALPALQDKSFELGGAANRLGASLHPLVKRAVGDLVRSMNCYYSNLIEGHDTLPRDIDRALRSEYVADPKRRNLQLEARAHIEVQAMVDHGDLDAIGTGQDLVRRLHREFCARLPDDLLWVENPDTSERLRVVPGEWRTRGVRVGSHVPVSPDLVPSFMKHFDWGYSKFRPATAVIAAASSHHRIAWIHPFRDGNGRTARLHSHAFLRRAGVGSDLWSVSRGLARTVGRYKEALARADYPPQGATDGRGTLSERGLAEFADYFIDTCADQVRYMGSLLEPAGFLERLRTFVQTEAGRRKMDIKAYDLLARMFTEGEITKANAAAVLGVSDRHARRIIQPLLTRGLIVSDGKFDAYRLAFPLAESDLLFPRLFTQVQDETPPPPPPPASRGPR
jgi:Fic family protein